MKLKTNINIIEIKKEVQKLHCKEKNLPHFAPHDGKCFCCKRQIYDKLNLEDCKEHITDCPYCHTSFCD